MMGLRAKDMRRMTSTNKAAVGPQDGPKVPMQFCLLQKIPHLQPLSLGPSNSDSMSQLDLLSEPQTE